MCKKLVIVSYAEVTDGEFSFEGRKYAYFINTKKQIKKRTLSVLETLAEMKTEIF